MCWAIKETTEIYYILSTEENNKKVYKSFEENINLNDVCKEKV